MRINNGGHILKPNVTGWVKCVHVYKELEMQSVHFWPNVVNA